MKKKDQQTKEQVDAPKIHDVSSIDDLIEMTNEHLKDTLFIEGFLPDKKDIKRCYRSNFSLKTRKEAEELMRGKKAKQPESYKRRDFFVYNEKTGELHPFRKNDYLMHEHGYFTYDGKNYISYDDNGNEIGRFSFLQKDSQESQGLPE